jgi:sterol desaturase/sphingolipid hydroxylase (fatty acid hydroxylase superfamily)
MIAVVFVPLERLIPFRPKQRLFRRYLGLDLLHYFLGGIFILIFVRLTYFGMPYVAKWSGLHASRISVAHLPGWEQFLVFELSATFLGYWVHRLEHAWAPLWRMHSIHESTRELDWLSAFRLHPLEPVMFQVLTIIPLWLFQMKLPVAFAYTMYSYVTAHVQHANVVFPIGPLKYIFPTPEFHRWHHARLRNPDGTESPMLKNFGQYPFWDLLFGTFYLPEGRPLDYGSSDGDKVPTDYWAQMLYPFGGHEAVLAWESALRSRFGMSERLDRVRNALAPTIDACDERLARLCLLPPPGTPEAPLMPITLESENR